MIYCHVLLEQRPLGLDWLLEAGFQNSSRVNGRPAQTVDDLLLPMASVCGCGHPCACIGRSGGRRWGPSGL